MRLTQFGPIGRLWLIGLSLWSQYALCQGHVDWRFTHQGGKPELLPKKNIGNEVIYQVVVDRFANGNQNNDCIHAGRFCGDGNAWYRYQGGDLRGLIQRLDYISQLGISRLWLTPIYENQPVQALEPRGSRFESVTSYHGYWVRDWFRLNPYFTDNGAQDFKIVDELVASAKRYGMRIYLDTVANHTSPMRVEDWTLGYLSEIEPLAPGQSHLGAIFEDGSYLNSYGEDVWRLQENHGYQPWFHQTGKNVEEGPGGWNNPHTVETYNLMNLADLNQNQPQVYDYLLRAHRFWLDRFPDLAGYRMDTIKHVNNEYWRQFSADINATHSDVEIFGEYYDGGASVALARDFYWWTHMSMLDFDYRDALKKVFLAGESFTRLTDIWGMDWHLGDARPLVTFLDSHDYPRLRGEGMAYEMMRLALATLLTSRGVPCLYYGMEQDLFLPGDPGDPYNRPMMKSFSDNHEFFHLIRNLVTLRKANPALRYGTTHVVHVTDHIFAFERKHEGRHVLVAMSKNPRSGTDSFALQNLDMPDGTYRNILTGDTYVISQGSLPVSLAYGDVIVLEK